MENLLLELLKEDKSLLLRNKDLIDELEKKITPAQRRKFSTLKMALESNVGEVFASESDKSAAALKAKEILSEAGMDSSKIDSVIKTFENVIDELEEYYKAEEEIPEPEPEPPKPEPPKIDLSKPEPPKPEPPKPEPPKPEPPKPEPPKPEPPKPEPPKYEPPKPEPPKYEPPKQEPPKYEPPKPEPPKYEPPKPQPPKKNNNFVIFLIVAIVLGMFLFSGSDEKKSSEPTSPPSSSSATSTPSAPPATPAPSESVAIPEAKTDLSLNGIDLGLNTQELIKNWGEPMEKERREDGFFTYHYGSIDVGIRKDLVHSFYTKDPKYKTSRGLHVGSTYDEVVEQYGTDSKNMDLNDLTLYEYPFSSINGEYGLLRFAVDKSNRVNYISVRIVEEEPQPKEEPKPKKEEPKPKEESKPKKESKIDSNVEQAATSFINYHKAITRGDFSTAYSIMASEQQKRLGPSLKEFSNGYRTTISSEITNLELVSSSSDFVVMDYVLDARDKTSEGTIYRQFAGEVQMEKIDGEWKIYSTQSKKIKEVKER